MNIIEGQDNWENFGADNLSGILMEYDGAEALILGFSSQSKDDRCEVTLDWIEEINSFNVLLDKVHGEKLKEFKIYPDDFRGLMMRVITGPEGVEINFLKNYQFVRVVMNPDKAAQFWTKASELLKGSGRVELTFDE